MSGYISITCSSALAMIFAVSFISKVRSPAAFGSFVTGLSEMRLVAASVARPLAVAVVALEAAVPLLLAVPGWRPAGLALAGGLLTAFTAAIALVLRRQVAASCPCFGSSTRPVGRRQLLRNVLLVTVVVSGFVTADGQARLDTGAVAVAVAVAIVLALAVILSERLPELTQAADGSRR
ncbi:hypothetical protein O7605_04870 [Verrucosispora sp. WMMA2121]|uniref:MauE/DoxX family redox-associated membrane protein n=1 Tax=Verrucosispora sp. WMMA2121 TaxID=3015164 RepID=UPI0022B6B113|nr:MauE/DoxX family redox-associated membrane protein [Verrucosispora sp. WMMA2121]MCZ7418850.1 hypothetical protein [Verrucosispora sp. WMMA2121]